MSEVTAPEFAIVASTGWFDGERHRPGPVTILVRDGLIAEISAGDHAAELQARGVATEGGAYLMPALTDAHVHLLLDGGITDPESRSKFLQQPFDRLLQVARANAQQALRHGVSCVRDAGDRFGINQAVRRECDTARGGTARVRSSGAGLKRAQRYGTFIATDVGDESSIRDAVDERSARVDTIKVVLTGVIDFEAGCVKGDPQFSLREMALITELARSRGLKTMAHCSGRDGLEVAVSAGVDSIEHGFFVDGGILARMRDSGIAWTPTITPVYFQWAARGIASWSANALGNLRRILDDQLKHVELAHRLGVELLVGTDAGSMGVEHGVAVHEEIQHFVEAGVPLEAALRTATHVNRRHVDLTDGRLLPGRPLEALLLSASPFASFQALKLPLRVWSACGDRITDRPC